MKETFYVSATLVALLLDLIWMCKYWKELRDINVVEWGDNLVDEGDNGDDKGDNVDEGGDVVDDGSDCDWDDDGDHASNLSLFSPDWVFASSPSRNLEWDTFRTKLVSFVKTLRCNFSKGWCSSS